MDTLFIVGSNPFVVNDAISAVICLLGGIFVLWILIKVFSWIQVDDD